MRDWQNLAGLVGSDWRSFTDFAIEQILKAPEPGFPSYNKKNDTFQSQHHMLTRRNHPKRTIHLSETPMESTEGAMDLDEPAQSDERRSSKRKM